MDNTMYPEALSCFNGGEGTRSTAGPPTVTVQRRYRAMPITEALGDILEDQGRDLF
jgi:hypothetical protein